MKSSKTAPYTETNIALDHVAAAAAAGTAPVGTAAAAETAAVEICGHFGKKMKA